MSGTSTHDRDRSINPPCVKSGNLCITGDSSHHLLGVKENVTIDWTVKENVKAKMRVMVKRILIKYNYPPDKQPLAVKTILEQAENFVR